MEPIGINNYMNIQFDEMVKQIERLGGKYDPTSDLSIDDQLFICQSLPKEEYVANIKEKEDTKENVSVKWNVSDTYKHNVDAPLTITKRDAIKKLKTFGYRTPPIEVAKTLEIVFADYHFQVSS
jgi:hypothetical protein